MHKCVCSVVSPVILKNIAANGTPDQRHAAITSLEMSSRLKGRRDIMSAMPLASPRQQGVTPAPAIKHRRVYNANHQETTPGVVVRNETDGPVVDQSVNEAFDGSGVTFDFFNKVFLRNSIDDAGLRLDSTVHYGKLYDNAFWDGTQMVYGDGDGRIFNRFTAALDVIIHELTHGITQHEANLDYYQQSGALNESFSDVFGSIGKQWFHNQDFTQADWLIGAGLLAPGIHGTALRSMRAPGTAYNDPLLGKDPQPSTMKGYVETDDDSGGVHINSGIPNHVFYLVCEQLKDKKSWEDPGQVWYVALRDRMRRYTNFSQAAAITSQVAAELYGNRGRTHTAVKNAWNAVGIKVR